MTIQTKLALVVFAAAATFGTASAHAQAADTFKAKCAMCHGADGLAATPAGKAMNTPAVTAAAFTGAKDADLIAITKSGKGKMPAYGGKIPDDQIAGLVAYMRTLAKK